MTINLRDYSRTAAQRGWGPGWPSCQGVITGGGTAIVTADLSGVRLSVHKRISRLVDLLLDDTERRGYLFRSGQCGGYNCRPIAGTSSPSNHSWGLAVDLNWKANPYVSPRETDMPAWMPRLWNRYGFAWGGDYSGKQDSMHYEFMGTPADADAMTALALHELSGTPATATDTQEEPAIMRQVHLDNPGSTPNRTGLLTIDGVGTSLVMPKGARAWLQYETFYPDAQKAVARLTWLVFRVQGGKDVPRDPRDLPHRAFDAIELPAGCTAVELAVTGLPIGGVFSAHLDGIGHG
ncbi:M15 family metallopeptidase [Pseudonocardia sp. WMMC193]|uniref:M15 family metallopeptidase n=1 Tax=Pseudonocardia sp. WMMC193 TaxID=2911965 RepID=UPI001F36455E|nr:M15 family metallopeptidase [Pseudonocardia sp. WMMC193]MCF7550957.1 M15 family metallopeptidase [Pseudonocardia sp. WMMC193]